MSNMSGLFGASDTRQGIARVCDYPERGLSIPVHMKRPPEARTDPICDSYGRLIVVGEVAGSVPNPDAGFPNLVQATSGGLPVNEASISTVSTQLVSLFGYNADATNLLFIQLWNDGAAELEATFPVPPYPSTFSLDTPMQFTQGLRIRISTQPNTYVAPVAPALVFTAIARTV
jgi:hypothetical protein